MVLNFDFSMNASWKKHQLTPNLKYQIKGDEVIITGSFDKKYCFIISSL